MTDQPYTTKERFTFQLRDEDAAAMNLIHASSLPYRLTHSEVIRAALREYAALIASRGGAR